MARIRGERDPKPTPAGTPTGMFSRGGRQKMDSNERFRPAATHVAQPHKKGPVKRDNRVKK